MEEQLEAQTEIQYKAVLRIEEKPSLAMLFGVFLSLIMIIAGVMQVLLTPFFSNFMGQSIGGMGLK